MNPAYAEWIEGYIVRQPGRFLRGKCKEATIAMVASFPELRQACGFTYSIHGREQHWWCVTPDGIVVDPTGEQYTGGVMEYEELDPNDPETQRKVPTGVCQNCGEDVYGGAMHCSDACAIEGALSL